MQELFLLEIAQTLAPLKLKATGPSLKGQGPNVR